MAAGAIVAKLATGQGLVCMQADEGAVADAEEGLLCKIKTTNGADARRNGNGNGEIKTFGERTLALATWHMAQNAKSLD
eukprot:scaffold14533_cov118-Isochrysis_galbana.AAC.1